MRNRVIRLLDLGLDDSFDASMTFVQAIVQNVNAGYSRPFASAEFVRTRDLPTVAAAFTALCEVLHVMAHGDSSRTPSFTSSDGKTTLSLGSLGEYAAETYRNGISTGAVIADGCKTGTGAWQKAVRDCLQGDIAYIGTSANIGWHESTVFCSAFYGSLFRNRGRGKASAEQAVDAAERAIEAYEVLTDRKCPFSVRILTPSRTAKIAFGL